MPEFSKDWTTDRVAEWEKYLSPYKGTPARFLELGVYEGRTSRWFMENILTNKAARLVGVDSYTPANAERYGNLTKAKETAEQLALKDSRFQLHVFNTVEGMRQLPLGFFDVAYIDADRSASGVLTDCVNVWAALKLGGILIVDDYEDRPEFPTDNPREGVDAFLSCFTASTILWKGRTIGIKKLFSKPA